MSVIEITISSQQNNDVVFETATQCYTIRVESNTFAVSHVAVG
jgi:hypothetical protein